jgi:Protein of unknown function (DUF2985)
MKHIALFLCNVDADESCFLDPEVQTLSTLTNVQNSLFIPDLGSWLNRRPVYNLSDAQAEAGAPRAPRAPRVSAPPPPPVPQPPVAEGEEGRDDTQEKPQGGPRPDIGRSSTITSQLQDGHYAALPHGATLEGWSEREKAELDDHVRHMMHSRRAKFKRTMKGFAKYVRQPLGFFVTLYATLITLFGLAWVIFLIGWIYVENDKRQDYLIHIIDSVLVALFAIMGDGLAPFRAIDTYHMCFVMHYARIVKKARKKAEKAKLRFSAAAADLKKRTTPEVPTVGEEPNNSSTHNLQGPNTRSTENDTAVNTPEADGLQRRDSYTLANNIVVDIEDARSGLDAYQDSPLTPKQQKKLYHHQTKLAKSHSFYRPNETETHYAFPLSYAIAIVFLLDFHSCLQISLGVCTWGIDYRTRHKAITSVILAVSITVNITAGIVITAGGRKTRKNDVWLLMTRQELTSDAMKHIQKKKEQEQEQEEAEAKGVASGSSDPDFNLKTKKPLKVELEKEKNLGHGPWG